MVDGIYHHYDDISAQHFKRRRPRQDRSVSDHFAGRLRRRSIRDAPHSPVADSLWYASLPDKIKKRQFSREEQLVLARHLRASVILDAADEAVYKIGRRASRLPTPEAATPTLSSRPSMESFQSERDAPQEQEQQQQPRPPIMSGDVPQSFYETFRWLDEEEDLDLRLFLDDYHANLREALPSPTKERRPSFRRHLSITKIPFGRPSLSSSRPATKDATTSPVSPVAFPIFGASAAPQQQQQQQQPQPQHARRKSRALSLITPRHAASESISTIDPAAAHYQDPEARLKLRVYLASPQKFDEAIEFGFPSAEVLQSGSALSSGPKKRKSRPKLSDGSENLRTFLADDDDDDDERLDSDGGSLPDPDSPKTPHPLDTSTSRPVRPMRIATDPTHVHRPSDSYAQVPASSREMTLRMTLTRPDLRACEDQIYGWQYQQQQQLQQQQQQQQVVYAPGRKSHSQMRDESIRPMATYIGDTSGRPKESIEQVFAGLDHWGPDPADRGVMKRIWNRVRRS